VAYGSRADARLAIEAAVRAFPAWRETNVYNRADFLHQVAGLMRQRADRMAEALTREVGKPLTESKAEVLGSAATLEWSAEAAKRDQGEFILSNINQKRIFTLRSPVGVVAGIAPWNFPLMLLSRKLGPALAVGCTFVGRAASQTPRATMELFNCIHDAGLPAGVANLVTGPSSEQGKEFVENPAVKKISFTGSTEVGRMLMAAAAGQVKKLSLELGGHAPFIVGPDADLIRAADVAVKGKFRNMGQSCIAPSRFYVPRERARAFAEHAARLASALKIGNGLEPGVDVGPLIDEARLAGTEALVGDIKRRGGTILCGGKRPSDPALAHGYFYEPTVALDVTDEMEIAKEEPFAPILPVMAYDSIDEAIARANSLIYGLAAYAVTNDMALMFKLADRLESGVIGINEVAPAAPQAPFGGVKQSGVGREGGWQVLDAYTETKMVSIVL
jgi:succinate-semialdehyde dehydrogenase/glutarate-semialdehyde dehydrogenase